jgi:hypothetical protein
MATVGRSSFVVCHDFIALAAAADWLRRRAAGGQSWAGGAV